MRTSASTATGVLAAALFASAMSTAVPASAESPSISGAARACLEGAGGDRLATSNCWADELQRQDKALNRLYQATLAAIAAREGFPMALGAPGIARKKLAADLTAAQRAWLRYRNAECTHVLTENASSSYVGVNETRCKATLTAERVYHLQQHHDWAAN